MYALPVKLKSFWDAPRMWLAASRRPLFSCFKRQALLNSLSANQLFHLDPFMDRWCQRISLSDKIYDELMIISNERSINWASIMTTVINKISEYFNRLEEIPERKLPINNASYNGTTGKLEIDLLFFILLGLLFLVANLLLFRLYRSNLLHPTVILWYSSISLRFLAQLIQLTVDVNFAKTAHLFYAASISCFYASLLVLGSGFTIVHQMVPRNHMIAFLMISLTHVLINLCCQISMGLTRYEVGVFSRYHSPSGYVYLGLQLCSYIAYLFICSYTCIKWSGKRIFFIRFMAISCIWPDKTNIIFPYHTSSISTIPSIKQDDNDNWKTKLVTETVSSTSTAKTTTTKSPQLSIIPMKKNIEQIDNTKSVSKKVLPPPRPNPPRLFNLTGKPGDLPAPGSIITSGLSELSKTPMNSPKRPQTTPNLNSGVNSPRLQTIDKAGSTH
ncbi:hypothetical protein Smp_125130 [Schistosoma mansoni]|uniref:hypothetical protein n=1 Tax=Schistosoma mansoni TaxID=6183 RepID=UPI0001A636C6|nr:hypothetical protein Smp_125130 [Schistosoma mansoni]|eukprot:XP_018646613.1 hypothetical protein Smp_125130 [Schistosoma mansoni]